MCISISGTEQISANALSWNSGFVGIENNIAFGFRNWKRRFSTAVPLVSRSIALRIAGGRGAGDDTFCACKGAQDTRHAQRELKQMPHATILEQRTQGRRSPSQFGKLNRGLQRAISPFGKLTEYPLHDAFSLKG
jgi:hypothetical protein